MTVARPRRHLLAAAVTAAALVLASMVPASAAGDTADEIPAYHPDAIPESQIRGNPTQVLTSGGSTQPEYFLAIYSGSTLGSYFSVANTICDVMATRFEEHRVRCVPLRSQGVSGNRELMRQGRAQVILVQSDTSWMAANGIEPIPTARSVASVHDEAGLLVVRRDSGINGPADLRNRRVNVGPAGSATRALWDDFLAANDIAPADLAAVYQVAQDYNMLGICDNYLDAYGLWIGHPTPTMVETLTACDARAVGMASPGADRLVAEKPFFFPQTVPAGTYPGQETDLHTYGFKAVLLADARAHPHVIYWLTRVLTEEVDQLRRRNPILGALDPEAMFHKGNFLPFHDGARKFWEEKGHVPEPVGDDS